MRNSKFWFFIGLCVVAIVAFCVAPRSTHASSVNQTNLVAEAILSNSSSTGTITLATSPGAGNYEVHYNLDLHTPCTTGQGGLQIAFGWTGNASRTETAGVWPLDSTNTATSFYTGDQSIHVASGNVTNTLTQSVACASGTATWDGNIYLIRIP